MRRKSIGFFQLVRLEYSLLGASGVFLSGLLAEDLHGFQMEYFVAFLVVFFCATGSFALNDYFDFEADRRNSRDDRPLVSGLLSKKAAITIGVASFSLTTFFSLFTNQLARTLVFVSLPLFFLYSLGLKKKILVKNVSIAYALAVTILFGSLVSDAVLEYITVYFAVMGFVVGLGFEIMLDIGDMEGDDQAGVETLATRFGKEHAALASSTLYALIMILDLLPFFVLVDERLHMDFAFLFLILVPVAMYFFVLKSLLRDKSQRNIFLLKRRVFATMFAGSLIYLVGVLV